MCGVLYFESVFWLLLPFEDCVKQCEIKKEGEYLQVIHLKKSLFLYTFQSRAFTYSFNWKKNCGVFIDLILNKSNRHELCYELKS